MHRHHARAGTASRLLGVALALVLGSSLAPATADAHATIRVEQKDGSVRYYREARVKRVSTNQLDVTSADGKGTLIIDQGACSYAGPLLRCLLNTITLAQGGKTRDLNFVRGTLYANLTDDPQRLSHSSRVVPPAGILASLVSAKGTYISITGTVDEVAK